jgi:hypothetical protein
MVEAPMCNGLKPSAQIDAPGEITTSASIRTSPTKWECTVETDGDWLEAGSHGDAKPGGAVAQTTITLFLLQFRSCLKSCLKS